MTTIAHPIAPMPCRSAEPSQASWSQRAIDWIARMALAVDPWNFSISLADDELREAPAFGRD